ncbi:DUF547 domain-containing protein [Maribacter sp. 2304DJ31-5]|uniref:DUF547 domain-containing protein n=1 Tax=Maribacter sp. 2304DJ31-5 TaxID=3386273 RepID=UPI0039BD7387
MRLTIMVKITAISFSLILGLYFLLRNGDLPESEFKGYEHAGNIDHSPWNTLLGKYVDTDGDVDYSGFKKDKKALQDYLDYLSANEPVNSWSKKTGLAYYINLYNAATVLLILENHPLSSIKDISSPWGKDRVSIGSKKYSLGAIEHKVLRKMNEPRIHFAINCASYSCPKLLNEAYTAHTLEAQLQKATKDFINDTKRNKITGDALQLSNIFKWYKKDFTENGSLIDYINPYTQINISPKADIDYLKYDWSLNEIK